MEQIGWLILGGVLASFSGLLVAYGTKRIEEIRTKKCTAKALCSEINENQKRLEPLSKINLDDKSGKNED